MLKCPLLPGNTCSPLNTQLDYYFLCASVLLLQAKLLIACFLTVPFSSPFYFRLRHLPSVGKIALASSVPQHMVLVTDRAHAPQNLIFMA
jgi:hypothetical protein